MKKIKFSLKTLERVLLGILAALAVFLGVTVGYIVLSLSSMDEIKKLETFRNKIPTKVYDVHGKLFAEFFYQKREVVPFDKIPHNLINALVAIEDNNFYQHSGLDIWGMFRALVVDIFAGELKQGGSTITQQLAKRLFTESEKTIQRKLRELWYAIQIEKKYSKNEILELYFNEIYFGHGAYGIESASQIYFQKSAKNINLGECAMLAALPTAPAYFSPIAFPNRARHRQRTVLLRMVDLGYITRQEADRAYEEFWDDFSRKNLSPTLSAWNTRIDKAPWFTEYVRQQLVKYYGKDRVNEDGLRVYTTLDLRMQKLASKQILPVAKMIETNYNKTFVQYARQVEDEYVDVVEMLATLFSIPHLRLGGVKTSKYINNLLDDSYKSPLMLLGFSLGLRNLTLVLDKSYNLNPQQNRRVEPQAAFVAIDPRNGYLKVLIGGTKFSPANRFHRAVQAYRQPGSSFKPFVYLAAIDSKMLTAGTPMDDSPVAYMQASGHLWKPRNYDRHYHGRIVVKQALRWSVNIVTVKILNLIGYERVTRMAAKLMHIPASDIEKRFIRSQALGLGGSEVTPYELCLGFSIIANEGRDVKPISILRVYDRDGKLIDDFLRKRDYDRNGNRIENKQLVDPGSIFVLTDMLKNYAGSIRKVKNGPKERDLGGKTGTTSNWRDVWFGGFTPQLAATIWFGFDDPGISLGRGFPAARVAAPPVKKFMKAALSGKPNLWWEAPTNVRKASVCAISGKEPTRFCDTKIGLYLLKGTGLEGTCEECKHVSGAIRKKRLYQFDTYNQDFLTRKRKQRRFSITGEKFDVDDLLKGRQDPFND